MEIHDEYILKNCSGRETISLKYEERNEDLYVSELEKKRKKDEENDLVENFFNGRLIIHNKRPMTFSDVIEFAIKPLPISLFSRAMMYLANQPNPRINLDDLSKAETVILLKDCNYRDYEETSLKKEPGYFEYFDAIKQR